MFRRTQHILIFFSVLLLGLFSCKEDTIQPDLYGSISGRILDMETNTPISGAAITTTPATSSIISDSKGGFALTNIPTGAYNITVKKSGYSSSTISVSVNESQSTEAVILLEKKIDSSPSTPVNPIPENKATSQEINLTLSWSLEKSKSSESLKYDLYLYSSDSPVEEKIAEDLTDTVYTVNELKYNTTYFWQVVSKDTGSIGSNSSLWSFKTKAFPQYPYLFADNKEGDYEIYMTDGNAENLVQLTLNSSNELWPEFIQRTNKLLFVSDMNLENQIYSYDLDNNELTKITNLAIASYHNPGMGFGVSPDGSKIIYGHYEKLYRVENNGNNLTELAVAPSGKHFREVNYSSQGDKIVALAIGTNPYDTEIYTMNADGSNMQLFVEDLPGCIGSPSFTIDGKGIMFTHDVSGNEEANGRQLNSHIYIISLDKKDTTDISANKPNGTNDLYPKFSPNGAQIIFTNVSNSAGAKPSVWIVDALQQDNTRNREQVYDNGIYPYWK